MLSFYNQWPIPTGIFELQILGYVQAKSANRRLGHRRTMEKMDSCSWKNSGRILLHEVYFYILDAQENTDPKHIRSSS